jgi:hypothetical protein
MAETDYGIALLDEDSGQYWNLNPTGALVLRTLLAGGSAEQAATELTTQHVVDVEAASRDVADLIGEFRATGLLVG